MTVDLENDLRSALSARAAEVTPDPLLAARVRDGARARRRRQGVLRVALGGAVAASLAAVTLAAGGLPGLPGAPGAPAGGSTSAAPAQRLDFVLAAQAAPGAAALGEIGGFEITALPDDLEAAGRARTLRSADVPGGDPARTTTSQQDFTVGGRALGTVVPDRMLTVQSVRGLAGDRAALTRLVDEEADQVRAQPGQTLERGTIGGLPAYLVSRGDRMEFVGMPDEGSGVVVGVIGRGMTRAELETVVRGLRPTR
jgi:hypothetical protein